jgi:hypothetical protein
MKRRNKRREIIGTITRHHGYWCLRYRERVRVGDTIKTVQRSRRLAPVDAMHKTRRSVEELAKERLKPINKAPILYAAIRLQDFAEGVYLPHMEAKRKPSTIRGYKQMWARYLKPRCANLLMHSTGSDPIRRNSASGLC